MAELLWLKYEPFIPVQMSSLPASLYLAEIIPPPLHLYGWNRKFPSFQAVLNGKISTHKFFNSLASTSILTSSSILTHSSILFSLRNSRTNTQAPRNSSMHGKRDARVPFQRDRRVFPVRLLLSKKKETVCSFHPGLESLKNQRQQQQLSLWK